MRATAPAHAVEHQTGQSTDMDREVDTLVLSQRQAHEAKGGDEDPTKLRASMITFMMAGVFGGFEDSGIRERGCARLGDWL